MSSQSLSAAPAAAAGRPGRAERSPCRRPGSPRRRPCGRGCRPGLPSRAAQRVAVAVDPRQPRRVRAGAGRVGVPAEVVGVRLAGLTRAARPAARPSRRRHRPRDPGQEAPARGVARRACRRCVDPGRSALRVPSLCPLSDPSASIRPLGPAALGGGEHALELGEVVERALGQHGAGGVDGDREGTAGDPERVPDVGLGSSRRRRRTRARARGRSDVDGRARATRQTWQPTS